MVNQKHLRILKQGIDAWNIWREKHLNERPNLGGADLSLAHLSSADLSHANLSHANLSHANLYEADLYEADLSHANLYEADLSHADLNEADLSRANLSHANLSDADLRVADLRVADLSDANLSSTNLSIADLSSTNLRNANLSSAYLSSAYLSSADFRNANLSGANLRDAYLRDADFSHATVGWTIFGDLDLRTVKGLETIKHKGPSMIGIDTIYRSEGNIPESFLRGAGINDTFIAYMHSLAGKPIEYYTCFISYSSKDQAFAERLYADLQSKNVRCWFAPEDLKIGDKFRVRIDESIRLYDKLLLILSEHSVRSPWVETEVETAFEKEHRQKKLALFPVKLDNTVMETEQAWAADIRRKRHIGDFTHWKHHDAYQEAFERLLRDLKAQNEL